MEPPRTIATVIGRDQARSIERHLRKALQTGAKTVLLYTSLDEIVEDPKELRDFPAPDLYVNETVHVIGLKPETEDFLARVTEHSDFIDHEKGGE